MSMMKKWKTMHVHIEAGGLGLEQWTVWIYQVYDQDEMKNEEPKKDTPPQKKKK